MATIAKVGLLRRAWHEVPDLFAGTITALLGVALCGVACYYHVTEDQNNRKYKNVYTVIRHDDPRADKVKKGPNVR